MEELLASSYMFGYLCLYLIFVFLYTSSYMFVYFVFASINLRI